MFVCKLLLLLLLLLVLHSSPWFLFPTLAAASETDRFRFWLTRPRTRHTQSRANVSVVVETFLTSTFVLPLSDANILNDVALRALYFFWLTFGIQRHCRVYRGDRKPRDCRVQLYPLAPDVRRNCWSAQWMSPSRNCYKCFVFKWCESTSSCSNADVLISRSVWFNN